jgi:hypothetical protein
MLAKDGLDLARLNTETADFHLRVHASEEIEGAIASPAADITRAVHPRTRSFQEWISGKTLGREIRPCTVATGHAVAPDPDLAGQPVWYKVSRRVKKVDLRISDRPSDGNLRGDLGRFGHDERGGHDGAFRWSIGIDQPQAGRCLEESLRCARWHHVSADDDLAQTQ